ncbi:MAG: hypothetical protein QMD95_04965 [Candidatus Hodarchaeaceae archaeon]|nr:hypothetical protein [Candidatus Hodarchaeaceae archaeon]
MKMEVDWSKIMKPYPTRSITLPNGDEMIVKSMTKDEIEEVADALISNLTYHKDLFDLVTSEMITEFYLWRENRPMWGCPAESHFNLVGRVNGKVVGVTNGVLKDPKTGCSLHTTTLIRGLQIGAYLWPCKLEHYFDVLGIERLEASAESAIGGRKLFATYGFTVMPFPEYRSHFGTQLQVMTKQQWDRIKAGKLAGERI